MLRPLVLLLASFALCAAFIGAPASAKDENGLLTAIEFRDAVVARIRTAEPTTEVTIRDAQGITVTIPGDPRRTGVQVNFERVYDAYLADPASLETFLDRWTRLALHDTVADLSQDQLVAVIRAQHVVTSYRAMADMVTTPFLGDLHVVLAFQIADGVVYATPSQLSELGVSIDDAWRKAEQNIAGRMGQLEMAIFEGRADGIRYVFGGSGLAPTSLLNTEFCGSEIGGHLVLVAARDGYYVADASAADRFREYVDWLLAQGQSESATILACRDGRLTDDVGP